MSRVLAAAAVLLGVLVSAGPARAADATGMPSNGEIFQTIKDLVANGPRRSGTPALDAAVRHVRDGFRASGLTGVHVEETPTYSWAATRSSLRVGDTEIPAFPVAYSQSPSKTFTGDSSTPPGGLRAPLVDGGLGTPADLAGKDVKGKIVVFDLKFLLPTAALLPLTEFLWDPQGTLTFDVKGLTTANPYQTTFTTAVKAIIDAGAAGFVGVLSDYFDSNRYYNELYRALNVPIPGMWVTKGDGARIRTLMAGGAQATMELATHRDKVPSHVVVGYLEGRSKDTIMVTSHHDSVWEGAVEDGSGAAEVMALARYYGRQPAGSREKTLMFATFDSHFSGYQAHQAFVKRHIDLGTDPHRIVGDVTVEHIAKQARARPDGSLELTSLPEARGIFENLTPALKAEVIDAVVRHDLTRTAVINAAALQPVGIPTDASFSLLSGLATVSLISGPVYLYDEADTLDKVLVDELQPVALAFADIIDAMDRTPSSQLGLPPLLRQHAEGEPSVDALEQAAAGAPACRVATRGRVVRGARLAGRTLSFRARRDATVRIAVRRRGSTRWRLIGARRVRACHDYRVRLPTRVTAVRVGGAVVSRRR